MTVWKYLKDNWEIKKSVIKGELKINPDMQWDEMTVAELRVLADHLDVSIGDLFWD